MGGLIPQQFIDDLIARADIVEVIGTRVQLKKAGREYKAVCPFHDEKTPSFTVSPAKGFYHCFGCGAHGTAIGFLMEYDHLEFPDAVEHLAAMMSIEVPRQENQRPVRKYDELFGLLTRIDNYYRAQLKSNPDAASYLKERDIDGATAKRFGLGFAPPGWSGVLDRFGTSQESIDRLLATGMVIRKDNGRYYDRFRERIMFPIRDFRGRCVGFGGRVIRDEEPKYLNSPETVLFHKGRELYGLFEARQALRSIDRLLVVEGYMDVVALARHGIDFATATLGTATTDDHVNRLFRLTEEILFCFDGDRAGRAAAWKALETSLPHLREGRQVRFVFLPEDEDPDSLLTGRGLAAFEECLADGVPLSEFLIGELSRRVDMSSVDGRARLAELAKGLLAKIPPGVYRELLTGELADRVGIAVQKLDTLISAQASNRGGGQAGKRVTRLRPSQAGAGSGRPSVVRRAITLVVHYPAAAEGLDPRRLDGLERAGTDLLRTLIETVQAEPNISTAGLLERWRSKPEGRHLGKLAAHDLPADEDFDPVAELAQCIAQLGALADRDRIKFLIEKQAHNALTDEERDELRALGRRTGSDE